MNELNLIDEPMIAPRRIAERRKIGVSAVHEVIRNLEQSGKIQPSKTATNRILLSFADASCVDAALQR
jgi:ribosomal protein S25